jgi:2-isopropylmalate synthase
MGAGMTKEKLYFYDTTLRDGAQTQGVDFSVSDKRLISERLDELGIDYIEGGWPGANPTDTEFFRNVPEMRQSKFCAFGMTKRAGRSAENDPGLAALLDAQTAGVTLVGKTWDYHVDVALEISHEENLDSIVDSIKLVADKGVEPLFDAEHFFDGFKANPDYALETIKAARKAGARWIVLCDTNGGTMPEEIETIVEKVTGHIPGTHLGIHCHNDTGNAVANSLAAIRAGARMVQGTINGVGERCGNADLMAIIPSMVLKETYKNLIEISISEAGLQQLTHLSRLLDDILNRPSDPHAAYVGSAAFAHKGGLHVSAVQKDPRTYEHVRPEAVGNERRFLVSNQAGRSNISARLEAVGIHLSTNDKRIGKILDEVKAKEFDGYSFDGADASFELLVRRSLGEVPDYFDVESFRVLVERRFDARGRLLTVSEATVKLTVQGERIISVGEGNGPVNALDMALRKDLGVYSAAIADLSLTDYKVRILNSGTEAVTRVLIESIDSSGRTWVTVGVSPNLVDASFQALSDSLTYKLFSEKVPLTH